MAGLGNKVKLAVLKGMEAVGQTASSLASNAQQKLQELNLETRRREILSDFPLRAYDLWQKGETLPQPLDELFKELSELDERLSVLRAQRYAKVEGAEGDAKSAEKSSMQQPEEGPALTESDTEGAMAEQTEADVSNPEEQADSEPNDEEASQGQGEQGQQGGNA